MIVYSNDRLAAAERYQDLNIALSQAPLPLARKTLLKFVLRFLESFNYMLFFKWGKGEHVFSFFVPQRIAAR